MTSFRIKKGFIISTILSISVGAVVVSENDYQLPYHQEDFIRTSHDFGYRFQPGIYGPKKFNKGIVIGLKRGAGIYAIEDGVVLSLCDTCRRGNGKSLVIKHNDSISATYYHLSEVSTYVGKQLEKGERIGTSGSTGFVTGNVLGVMVELNDSIVHPRKILPIPELVRKK